MKKNLLLAVSAVAALGIAFSSCSQAPSTQISLKTEADSLSYSFGASVAENIHGSLAQAGVVVDTMNVSMEYAMKISGETDEAKKASLQKEMRHKVDSLNKANEYAIQEFLIGFKDGVNSRPSKNNYNLGLSFGNQIAQQGTVHLESQFFEEGSDQKANKDAIIAAVSAVIQKKTTAIPQASSFLMMKSQEKQGQEMMKRELQGAANEKEGQEFLAVNKDKEGVVTLESGVQYKILSAGTGAKPSLTDRVECHYHGTLLDGTVFDSSVNRGEPAVFGVREVIAGWTEVLQLMPVGSKWEVYVPSDKAYGPQGAGANIGANATLIFQIELLEILK